MVRVALSAAVARGLQHARVWVVLPAPDGVNRPGKPIATSDTGRNSDPCGRPLVRLFAGRCRPSTRPRERPEGLTSLRRVMR